MTGWIKQAGRIRLWAVVAVLILPALACGGRTRTTPSTDVPSWSPDGQWIAYVSCESDGCTLALIQADGSGQADLPVDSVARWGPVWSPDSQQIAFVKHTRGGVGISAYYSVNLINADGSGSVAIGSGLGPVWSPDGSSVAWASMCGDCGDRGLNIADADGSNQTTITWSGNALIGWSPDGSRLFFQSYNYNSEHYETHVIDAETGDPGNDGEFITDALIADVPASLSPGGDRILFVHGSTLYTIGVDGTGLEKLADYLAENQRPTWSPDGSQIAFVTDRDGNSEVYVMQADGSSQVRLTNDPAEDKDPSWSPDGEQIVFISFRDSNRGDVFIMNADGSDPVNVTGH